MEQDSNKKGQLLELCNLSKKNAYSKASLVKMSSEWYILKLLTFQILRVIQSEF